MDKYINFEISKTSSGFYFLQTTSKYADRCDRDVLTHPSKLYDVMLSLTEKYNNKPDGCIGVTFTMG